MIGKQDKNTAEDKLSPQNIALSPPPLSLIFNYTVLVVLEETVKLER